MQPTGTPPDGDAVVAALEALAEAKTIEEIQRCVLAGFFDAVRRDTTPPPKPLPDSYLDIFDLLDQPMR